MTITLLRLFVYERHRGASHSLTPLDLFPVVTSLLLRDFRYFGLISYGYYTNLVFY